MLESTENLSDVNTATARVRIQQRPRRRSVTAQWRALDWVPLNAAPGPGPMHYIHKWIHLIIIIGNLL